MNLATRIRWSLLMGLAAAGSYAAGLRMAARRLQRRERELVLAQMPRHLP